MQGSQLSPLAQTLSTLSRSDVAAINRALGWISDPPSTSFLLETVQEQIQNVVGRTCRLSLNEIIVLSKERLETFFSPSAVFCGVEFAPSPYQMSFVLDLVAARTIIDGIVGANSITQSTLPLSKLENGILKYCLLKITHRLAQALGPNLAAKPSLADANCDRTSMAKWGAPTNIVYDLKLLLGDAACKMQVVVNEDLSRSAFVWREGKSIKAQLGVARASGLQVPVIGVVGQIILDASELDRLGIEDVIVLEKNSLTMNDGILHGDMRCQVGTIETGIATGRIFLTAAGTYAVEVNGLVNTALPEEKTESIYKSIDMTKTIDDAKLPNQPPGWQNRIVETISTPLIVELGRRSFSILELGQLKKGQIIDLNRSPNDLVELVVAGKIIGKGELLNVEGELGVRIVSLLENET